MARVDQGAVAMAELWRGGVLESVHLGHAVVCDARGIVAAWGNPEAVIFPRSSAKMIQALPLIESGAAEAAGLTDQHLALACASHQGAGLHVGATRDWLAGLGLTHAALRCGTHEPYDPAERNRLITTGEAPCPLHNNCSGKHCGFVTSVRHLGQDPEYTEIDHPLQQAVRAATEDVAGEAVAGWGVDGCSAPNFALTLGGLARAMAAYATAGEGSVRGRAMRRLVAAMAAHPDLVAGEGRACTDLMQAMGGRVAIKTGAEAVFVAILPDQGLGIALKVVDGTGRASEAAIAALLVRYGVLDPAHPAALRRLAPVQRSWRGIEAGVLCATPGLM